jgi:hypothetical protein
MHVAVDWSIRSLLHIQEVASSGLVPETDFLEVFGYHQGLMLLFLSEAHLYSTKLVLTSVNGTTAVRA